MDDDAIVQQKPDPVKSKAKRIAFFLGCTGVTALGAFGMMLRRTGKKDPDAFGQQLEKRAAPMESGVALASKALGRATVYAVGGVSLFCFITWKLIGAKDMKEFSEILGRTFPKIKRSEEPQEEIDWDEIFYGPGKNKKEKEKELN